MLKVGEYCNFKKRRCDLMEASEGRLPPKCTAKICPIKNNNKNERR